MHKYALIGILIKLFLGSATYFSAKVMNSTCGYPLEWDSEASKCPDGQTSFRKAFFITWCNFFSLSLTIWIFAFIRRPKLDPAPYTRRNILLQAIPGTIEVCAFCLATSAQIIMALSLAMIMKGAKVVFSALFTTIIFKKRLPAFRWISVAVCVGGLAIAGSSEYMNQSKTSEGAGRILIGLGMAMCSEAMFAFQVIFDESMMKRKGVDPTFCVGLEGVYGSIFMIPVVLLAWLAFPGAQAGSYENLADTLYRISQSGVIIAFLSFYVVAIFVVAVADATITKYLSGVHSSLVSVGRTIVVWILELLLFYCAPAEISKMYGHKWDVYSPLKVAGFVIVVVAIFMYDGTIKLPWIDYSSIQQLPEKSEDNVEKVHEFEQKHIVEVQH
jgi:hypothetical protein